MNLTVWSGNPAEIEVTANTNLHHRGGVFHCLMIVSVVLSGLNT